MIKAKKHFGQNFLIDKSILSKITQAIPKKVTNIVEIGPGLGDLTQALLQDTQISHLKAYEIDADLIPLLRRKFANELANDRLSLLHQDASASFSLDERSYFLVANLPYYVASNIILQALGDELCAGLLVMVQKEVALKFCASAKDSEYSAIGVLSELLSDRRLLFEVPPECFNPPPKVNSAVMRLEKKSEFKELVNDRGFQGFLRECFKAPRKQLLKNLANFKAELMPLFESLNLSTNIRPHELDAKSYLKIYEKLQENKG